jgi:hypothetical protein
MTAKTMWMIGNPRSGHYLPHPSNMGRGFTHLGPVEPASGHPPRMFREERHAKVALTWWLAGPADRGSWTDFESGLYDETGPSAPDGRVDPERAKMGMTVLPVRMSW